MEDEQDEAQTEREARTGKNTILDETQEAQRERYVDDEAYEGGVRFNFKFNMRSPVKGMP